jgi:hypothetical protein
MSKVTIVFTEAHVHRGEQGADTVELVGACGGQTVSLSRLEPRGDGDKFVRGLGFDEYTLNEPAPYVMRGGREGTCIAAHRVDRDGVKWRKVRKGGVDSEVKVEG